MVRNKCPVCNSCLKQLLFDDGVYYYCDLCIKVYKKNQNGVFEDVSNKEYHGIRYFEHFRKIFRNTL